MTELQGGAARAHKLLRFYPKTWRARYGDEFAELLIAEIEEQPRSWRRTVDIARSGIAARLAVTGVAGPVLEPAQQVEASLVTQGVVGAAFLAFAATLWAQLTVGWQWVRPDAAGTIVAMVAMSVAMLVLAALALAATAPVFWHLCRQLRRAPRRLAAPAFAWFVSLAALAAGTRYFENGWPGTGGHAWTLRGLVPGGIGAVSWAATLSVTSYWAHPGALSRFPAAEIAWMALSPVAIAGVVLGAVKTFRRLEFSARALRFETRLARTAVAPMTVFLAATCCWLLDGGSGPQPLFRAGIIDIVGVMVMAAALAATCRASDRATGCIPYLTP